MSTYTVFVSGYYSYAEFKTIGDAGVYLVYRENKTDHKFRLIYIGKADVISNRINENHQHYNDWLEWAYGDLSALRFSLVSLPPELSLEKCEAAMIYALQPPINIDCKDSYSHEDVEICFSGRPVCNRTSIVAAKNA